MMPEAPRTISLRGLLGAPLERLPASLGDPATDRTVGAERWLIFEPEGLTLRLRCAAEPPHRIAFWTASFEGGFDTLREAAESVGLWPACEPDAIAAELSEPLIRRSLPAAKGDGLHSLTASVRARRITAISAFDEPPDWL